jgi:hypothetical protein
MQPRRRAACEMLAGWLAGSPGRLAGQMSAVAPGCVSRWHLLTHPYAVMTIMRPSRRSYGMEPAWVWLLWD